MNDYYEQEHEILNDYHFCFSVLFISFTLLIFALVVMVMTYSWQAPIDISIAEGLKMKLNGLKGWPSFLAAYIIYIWTLLYMGKLGIKLQREGFKAVNFAYFLSLYLYIAVMVHGLIYLTERYIL